MQTHLNSFRRAALISAIFFLLIPNLRAAPESASSPPAIPLTPAPSANAATQKAGPVDATVENSVVKVFSTVARPDPYRPWSKETPSEITGSGTVIPGKRILTNAHMVLYASQIEIQANQAGDKIAATVESVAPGIDLAVLKIDDEKFFDSHPAIPFQQSLPDVKESVLVYGYPTGGTSLSITKGIISRIEFTAYTLAVSGLRIQIDAAINAGNSGGPAIVDGKIIGLAFSHLTSAQNIGYIIPWEEIELFLKDVADGRYDGKPAMFEDLQTLENPALRAALKLAPSQRGILVHRPFSSDANYPLKEWDLITHIGDTPVDDQGMVEVNQNLRVRFQYLVQKTARENKVELTIVRAGREMRIELPVLQHRPLVIPDLDGAYPSYFIFGPMSFSEATAEFLAALSGKSGASYSATLSLLGSPLIMRIGDKPAFDGEHLVVVSSPFFPDKLVTGYGNPAWQVVKTINGQAIKNLSQMVGLLRDLKDPFITIAFDTRTGGETLIFPRAEMAAATEKILDNNGIRSQGSPDVMMIWGGR